MFACVRACVNVCVCVCMHTHMLVHTHICACTRTHASVHARDYAGTHERTPVSRTRACFRISKAQNNVFERDREQWRPDGVAGAGSAAARAEGGWMGDGLRRAGAPTSGARRHPRRRYGQGGPLLSRPRGAAPSRWREHAGGCSAWPAAAKHLTRSFESSRARAHTHTRLHALTHAHPPALTHTRMPCGYPTAPTHAHAITHGHRHTDIPCSHRQTA